MATLLLGFAGWCVWLGGMGAVSQQCSTADLQDYDCARGLQLEWWSGWFEVFILVALAALMRRGRLGSAAVLQPLYAFLSMATVVLMWTARSVMTRGSFSDLVAVDHSALDAAAAGAVILCLSNFALVLLLGHAPTWQGQAADPASGPYLASSAPYHGAAACSSYRGPPLSSTLEEGPNGHYSHFPDGGHGSSSDVVVQMQVQQQQQPGAGNGTHATGPYTHKLGEPVV